jgi:hypothetical protein
MTAAPATLTRPTIQGAPAFPQVNLLPPEIRAGRSLGKVKTWLGIALLSLVLLLAAVFVLVTWNEKQAEETLAETQDRNAALLAEQAQYAEVPQVLGAISNLSDARTYAMQTDVLWQPYLAAIAAATPPEVSIDLLTVTQSNVWATSAAPVESPLATPGTVGTVSLSGRSLTVPNTADWEDALAALPGITNANIVSVQLSSEEDSVYYQVTGSIQLTMDAFSGRFDPAPTADASAEESTDTAQEGD